MYFSGKKLASGPTTGQVPFDTGGPVHAVLPFKAGTVTLTEDTPVAVADTAVTANSAIIFTLKTVGGTVGAYPSIKTITPGTGFTVAGSASDTSIFNYLIIG